MKYKVEWEKWQDAYDVEETPSVIEKSEYELEEMAIEEALMKGFEPPIKTIMTPFGILPLTEHSLASKHFNFWVGHTNFNVNTRNHQRIIEDVLGVETLDIFTPLRFRIAIGKLFQGGDVMSRVTKALQHYEQQAK